MATRLLAPVVAVVAALTLLAAPAPAAPAATSCSSLSHAQFERLGESLMTRMAGSRAAFDAMTARMTQVLGTQNTDRMQQLMGRRVAGCIAGAASGPGMMGSSDWGWMRNGAWQHMSRTQWRDVAGTMMGGGYVAQGDGGWSTAGVLAAVLGALLLGGLAVFVVGRRRPAAPAG